MRRTTTVLRIVLGLALCAMVFALASCETDGGESHTHTYSSDWSHDEEYHWHAASCEHTTEMNERAAHTFDGSECSVCGYTQDEEKENEIHTHTYSSDWTSDEEYHWHAASCKHTTKINERAAHSFDGSECSVCGYTKEDPYKDFVFQTNGDEKILVSYNGTSTDITIPHGVTSIGVEAFYDCRNIISVMIPNSVTSIGTSAFENCSRLTSVKIPASVTSIEESVFSGCSSLISITLPFVGGSVKTTSDTYQYPLGYIFGTSYYTGGVGTKQDYYGSSTSSTTSTTYYIPATLRKVTITGGNILYRAFYNCNNLTSVTIESSVTSIGASAFSGCSSLTSVSIPDSVTSIGDYAFSGCRMLKYNQYDKGYYLGNAENPYLVLIKASNTSITACDIHPYAKIIYDSAFSGCSSLTSITIPNNVTSIETHAFNGCNSLKYNQYDNAYYLGNAKNPYLVLMEAINTSIATCNIHTNAKFIYDSAFSGCSSLTSITIPDNVVSIGNHAFHECSTLPSITIPSSVTSIESYAFNGCSRLTSITIPNNVTSIESHTFNGCSSLTSVTIPDSVTSIGSCAFENCYRLREVYNLSTLSITKGSSENGCVGYYAYDVHTSKDDESKLSTDDNGFVIHTNGDEKTVIFYGATATDITIPNGVTRIEFYAFSGCNSLMSVTIPNSVTSIESYAFSGCNSLMSVTIPNSVTSIGESAFSGCCSLVSITLPFVGSGVKTTSDTYQYPLGYIFGTSSYTGGVATTQSYYSTTSSTSTTSITYYIPATLREATITGGNILYGAFYNCSNLTSVTIGSSVASIGERAFSECRNLMSVTIGNGVTSIGSYAFKGCSRLMNVTIGNGVTNIGYEAFSECSMLKYNQYDNAYYLGNAENSYLALMKAINTSIATCDIHANAKIVYYAAFSRCSSLTGITIPDSVTRIESDAFSGCSSLKYNQYDNAYYLGNAENPYLVLMKAINTSIATCDIHTNAKIIYDYAFYKCSSLTSITIPDNVVSIGNHAFHECSTLPSITIPSSVTSIGSNVFCECSSLTSITIPDSVTNLGGTVFSGCIGLTNVTIGNGVTSIGNVTFSGCISLKSITIPNSVTSIEISAFSGCNCLTSITIPNSVTSIGSSAFKECSSLTSIQFQGTKAQWNAIVKGSYWNSNTGSYTITCTDGTISK